MSTLSGWLKNSVQRLLLMLSVALITSMLLGGLLIDDASDKLSSAMTQDEWSLPDFRFHSAPTPMSDEMALTLWGRSASDAMKDDMSTKWRLVGVSGEGGQRVLLASVDNEKIERFSAGDRFLDGTIVDEVFPDRVRFRLQSGDVSTRAMYSTSEDVHLGEMRGSPVTPGQPRPVNAGTSSKKVQTKVQRRKAGAKAEGN